MSDILKQAQRVAISVIVGKLIPTLTEATRNLLEHELAQREPPSSAWDRCAERAAEKCERRMKHFGRGGKGDRDDAAVWREDEALSCMNTVRVLIGKYEPPTGDKNERTDIRTLPIGQTDLTHLNLEGQAKLRDTDFARAKCERLREALQIGLRYFGGDAEAVVQTICEDRSTLKHFQEAAKRALADTVAEGRE